ncbi:TonB family protein [Granulicella arctica]|uniref:Alkaline phosphatase D n=1 Tax=Granulicella arctica TaxID=940613 RepID=A0A7Y9PGD2_9BACT|nr:TonB family protein [Granulicella arctica]NYF79418.1 alkaline phosphatase D [Granulicella arctica]
MRQIVSALRLGTLAGVCLLVQAGSAQNPTPVITAPNPPNTAAQQAKHYVVLVSLDGFRYDYPTKYGAPHLLALGAKGASAPDGMLPSYPSLTFPNHLAIITGLYPEHHGIVGNSFFDPSRDATYVYTQSKTNGDGSWYGGTPLWVLAEQQGMRSACLFWPGSEAEIGGKRPSYYLKYDNDLDDEKRIDQVIAWLQLPLEQRPHFITLYYPNVDHAGHNYGPDSDEVRAAVHHLDDMMGDLQIKLDALHLPIDLVVVADHGMAALKPDNVNLSDFANLSNFHTEGSLLYPKTDADAAKAYEEFKAHPDPRFSVYRRADVPANLHFNSNPREGDPVIVPNGPYTIRAHASLAGAETQLHVLRGGHGFDPHTMPEMKAIFFADGPDIRPATTVKPFENVNIYPFVAEMLGLTTPDIDGNIEVLQAALSGQEENPRSSIVGNVLPPTLTHSVEPHFTKEALKAKKSGSVLVQLWVGQDGLPSHLHLVKSLGYGLDEKAMEAISKYRFKPATEGGTPVTVVLNIEVNFKYFDHVWGPYFSRQN